MAIPRRRADRRSRPVVSAVAGRAKPVAGSAGPPLGGHASRSRPARRKRLLAGQRGVGRARTIHYLDLSGSKRRRCGSDAIAGGLSRVGGDTLVPFVWPGVACPPRDVRAITAGPRERCGSARPRPCGGIRGNTAVPLRSPQRASQRQGVCDPGRRPRHGVDDVEQGPARRQDCRPRRLCRRRPRGAAVAAVRRFRRDDAARSACWPARARCASPTAPCGFPPRQGSSASIPRSSSTTRCRRRSSSKA